MDRSDFGLSRVRERRMFGGASTPEAPLESETRWVGNVVSDLSKSENLALAHVSSRTHHWH
ncbi:MAG TPA: hypothetical protein VIX17_18880 [Pyrinomonadaceae bacterium]